LGFELEGIEMTIPSLVGQRIAEANVNEGAEVWALQRGVDTVAEKRFTDPYNMTVFMAHYHASRKIVASYGSYGEERTFVWRGTYLDAMNGCIHLGVDINVDAGTEVIADRQCVIAWKGNDFPERHGWGNRVVVKLRDEQIWLIYAHLASTPHLNVGDVLNPGDVIGRVGEIHENGWWFPHLHVQALIQKAWIMFCDDPAHIDGYCPKAQWNRWRMLCPNPAQYISIP
jgi:murein DD-endopeptidase MepM/ murein hydrolase activator NlpD